MQTFPGKYYSFADISWQRDSPRHQRAASASVQQSPNRGHHLTVLFFRRVGELFPCFYRARLRFLSRGKFCFWRQVIVPDHEVGRKYTDVHRHVLSRLTFTCLPATYCAGQISDPCSNDDKLKFHSWVLLCPSRTERLLPDERWIGAVLTERHWP